MTHWLVLSAFVVATALGACRGRDRNSNVQPSAMPVEQTDTPSSSTPPRDSPGTAGAATSNDPWAQPATPSSSDTAPSRAAKPGDPWAEPAPSSPDTTPSTTAPSTAAPSATTPSATTPSATNPRSPAPDTGSSAARPTLPFPPPGTAGKTVPPTRPMKPDEPGAIEQDRSDPRSDSSAGSSAGSGNRDFGRSP